MTMRAADPIYTIGHSTRSLEEFVDMLRGAGVTQLADVRSIPRSRTNPHYNLDTFPAALAHYQISHVHLPSLGGRRPREPSVDPSLNDYWQNQSFHNLPTMPRPRRSRRDFASFSRSAKEGPLRSCVRRRSGGGVIAGSSRTIFCAGAGRSPI